MEPDIRLRWLLKLRWTAIAGQALLIAIARLVFELPLATTALAALIAFGAASNLGAWLWLRRGPASDDGPVAFLLLLDVAILTGLLAASGGASNPFSVLYLVHVALAAVLLGSHWPWVVAGVSILAFGALFLAGQAAGPHVHGAEGAAFAAHLYGMWTAFTLAAAAIAWSVVRITKALADQEGELARARERQARAERLASLGTLAAGAAHELGSPLATIAVASRELERAFERAAEDEPLREEARLIRSEVDRCRAILERMAAEAGQSPMEAPAPVSTRELMRAVRDELETPLAERVSVRDQGDRIVAPTRALRRALVCLVRNALDASAPDRNVTISAHAEGRDIAFVVEDRGEGMSPDVLSHVGEPFFTTKPPGRGQGLGVFLARTLAEQLGGTLGFQSRSGEGTRATLTLPGDPAATAGARP